MTEPALTFTDDPAQASPQQRADAIAAIFAAAILRMRPAITHTNATYSQRTTVTASVSEKVSESGSNPLALLSDTSVTVTAG